MKRGLVYLLVALVFAALLGTLVARDPGYVLVSYDGMSLQTGLWVMLAMLAVLIAAVYYLLRLFNVVGRSAAGIRAWRLGRASSRTGRLTARGLVYFQEGDFERAERFLQSGAGGDANAAVNYLYAAKAADAQGKGEQREAYLRQAREADAESHQAVAVAAAEMALSRGEYREALRNLDGVKSSGAVLWLKARALQGTGDWTALTTLMPALRKAGPANADLPVLQKRVALECLSAAATDDARTAVYKKLPDDMRRDPDVVTRYCGGLQDETRAEAAIRAALKRDWCDALLVLYGSLGRVTLARRIKTAEGWQKVHPDDAALQLCLGELHEANGDKEKARAAYQRSLDLEGSPAASRQLGRLLAFDGDYKKSNEYLNQALNQKEV